VKSDNVSKVELVRADRSMSMNDVVNEEYVSYESAQAIQTEELRMRDVDRASRRHSEFLVYGGAAILGGKNRSNSRLSDWNWQTSHSVTFSSSLD
jgi:hypothetical protein